MNITHADGFVILSEPGTIRARQIRDTLQITTSAGLTLAPRWMDSSRKRIEVKTLGGGWEDVTAHCGSHDIPTALVQEWAARNQRTLVDFQVTL